MLSITEYFLSKSRTTYPELNSSKCYDETIGDFYINFIFPHFKKIFQDNRKNFIKWCEIIEDYADLSLPIYWIRKFESGSGKAKINDNRRTSTTVLTDTSKNAVAAFAYISNFDAQELYNIFLNVDPVDKDEFRNLMLSGEYKFHYDNGKSSTESTITSFPCLAHANSLGVFNRAKLYLAHITDVNGTYASIREYPFDAGTPADWKALSAYSGFNFSTIFPASPEKKIRVLEYKDDILDLKAYLKAHFFRFVHPFNYYLVPGQNYEVNAIFGKIQKSIGEYRDLTAYTKYRMYVDFIAGDTALEYHYKNFEDAILIDDSKKISKNFSNIQAVCMPLESLAIHVTYGATVGKEGLLLGKLAEKISNTDELYDLYTAYVAGDAIVFYDHSGAKVSSYKPKALSDYIDLLEKTFNKATAIASKDCLQVKLEKPISPAATGSAKKTATTKTKSKPSGTTPSASTAKNDNESIVFGILNDMIARGLMTATMLKDLTDPGFTNRTFGISTYPFLVKAADFAKTGYPSKMFYRASATITIGGDTYRVCSQWIPKRIARLKDWHNAL